jgi:hypothetical protein
MRTVWRKQGGALLPTDDEALGVLTAHKEGAEVMVEVKGARNPRQHRLFFALCNVVAENDEHYTTTDTAKEGILRALQHVHTFTDRNGHLHITTKSIAFESMTQAEFDKLFKDAVNLVCTWVGTKPKELQDHVFSMVADKRYEGHRR